MLVLRAAFEPVGEAPPTLYIPRYRSAFHHFIKDALQQYAPRLYTRFFEGDKPQVKPYTFSVLMENGQITARDIITFTRIFFRFTASDARFLATMQNALIDKLHREVNITGRLFTVSGLRIEPTPFTRQSPTHLRTLSPILIRSPHNSNHYLVPPCRNFEGDEGFEEAFRFNLTQQLEALNPGLVSHVPEVTLEPVDCYRTLIKYEKNGVLLKFPAFRGTFALHAPVPLTNFLLRSGIGSRRSQGFGMVSIARSHSRLQGGQ